MATLGTILSRFIPENISNILNIIVGYNNQKDNMSFTFNNKVIFNKKINAPEVFKLEFDQNNNIIDIINIEFKDLPYRNT